MRSISYFVIFCSFTFLNFVYDPLGLHQPSIRYDPCVLKWVLIGLVHDYPFPSPTFNFNSVPFPANVYAFSPYRWAFIVEQHLSYQEGQFIIQIFLEWGGVHMPAYQKQIVFDFIQAVILDDDILIAKTVSVILAEQLK